MIVRIGHALLIIALLAATGGHWALLQTMAWTDMLTANLRTDPLEEALVKTFDGKHPCNLCKQISAGKKAEKKTELPLEVKKFEFVSERPAFVFSAPQLFYLQLESKFSRTPSTHEPSVPPPRSLSA